MLEKSLPNENGVLAALTPAVYARLTPNLKRVRLEAGDTLFDIGSTSDHAWFITKGIASLFTTTKVGDIVEAASVGREGVVGLSGIIKRTGMACWAQVQISGEALQIGVKTLQSMLDQEIALYKPLFEYTHALSEQIALTITCNRFHNTEQRLARWLLIALDRLSSNTITLTHDDMGQMLGISRSRISSAACALQKRGLIYYLHGQISILNRGGLEDAVCECYEAISRTIGHFLPPGTGAVSDRINR
jgi:CRP-like cAMP-binding protein